MKIINRIVFLVSVALVVPTVVKAEAEVNQRLDHQHARINNGVKNGSLSKQEAKSLRQQDKAIHKEEHAMRKSNGGKLTKADKVALNQQEDKVSKQIYADKHN